MKFGPWLYLIMVITGIFSYYLGWEYIQSLPQDHDGNIPFFESRIGIFMIVGGIALGFFGFLAAKLACETELINRHKLL